MLPSLTLAAAERWAAYYSDAMPAETFLPYDVIVFDSDSHPKLAPLKGEGKILLGYLSLGEAENYRSYFPYIKDRNLLLKHNPKWKGHTVIDVRRPEWTAYVIDSLIPGVLAQGFDGIMIDTMDSVIQPELDDPEHYKGMQEAAVKLIRTIRLKYPRIKIMLNRGFAILPQVAHDLDMEMAESIYTDWQPGEKKPRLVSAKEYAATVDLLKAAQEQSPKLKIYTIDYWPPGDTKGVRRIYAAERARGFVPYVSTINLQAVYPEPQ